MGLRDVLYYLDSQPKTQGQFTQAYYTVRADDFATKNLTLASAIRASFFLLLQLMFPSSFLYNNASKFQCETYETC